MDEAAAEYNMSGKTQFLTIIVPEAHLDITRHYACCVGESMYEMNAFERLTHQDAQGNKYAIAMWRIKPKVIDMATSPLVRPEFDMLNEVDLTKAATAQTLVRFDFEDVPNSIVASTAHTSAEIHIPAGLTKIPDTEDEV